MILFLPTPPRFAPSIYTLLLPKILDDLDDESFLLLGREIFLVLLDEFFPAKRKN